MNTEYFIVEGERREGPFDLVAMLRKIRNGAVTPETLVATEEEEPRPATDIQKFAELFAENGAPGGQQKHIAHKPSIMQKLNNGMQFLLGHFNATLKASLVVLFTMGFSLFGYLIHLPIILNILISITIFIYLFGDYYFYILRNIRGQTTSSQEISALITPYRKNLVLFSIVLAMETSLGMVLLFIPGLLVLTFYIFTPLLIIERKLELWDAMETSRKTMWKKGIDVWSVVFALIVINFIGAIFIIPLVITLPITVHALAELYEEHF